MNRLLRPCQPSRSSDDAQPRMAHDCDSNSSPSKEEAQELREPHERRARGIGLCLAPYVSSSSTEKREEKGCVPMRLTKLSVVGATLFLSGTAAADSFLSCQDARDYGYNMARFYVSGIYNKVSCDRARASTYENRIFGSIPSYWAKEATTTTPEKASCMLQGSLQGWLGTILQEYAECRAEAGFESIRRKLVGMVAASLFSAFYWQTPDYYTTEIVEQRFAYEFQGWPLAGTIAECVAQIDVDTLGVPGDLSGSLKIKMCR